LPETLEEVVAAYGHSYFKLKVAGDPVADVARLSAIAAVLDRLASLPRHPRRQRAVRERRAALELWNRMERTPALRRLVDAVLFIEQPIARKVALIHDVSALAAKRPVVIDESDGDLDAFPEARNAGYRGVSSKTCKGVYKSILNRARCELWNAAAGRAELFMSGEDLTQQAASPSSKTWRWYRSRPHPRREERPSLRQRHGRAAGRRAAPLPRGAPGPLRARRSGAAAHRTRAGHDPLARLRRVRDGGGADWESCARWRHSPRRPVGVIRSGSRSPTR